MYSCELRDLSPLLVFQPPERSIEVTACGHSLEQLRHFLEYSLNLRSRMLVSAVLEKSFGVSTFRWATERWISTRLSHFSGWVFAADGSPLEVLTLRPRQSDLHTPWIS